MDQFILEYHPAGKDSKEVILHYNYAREKVGFWDRLFSNGYLPLALVDDSVAGRPEFEEICQWLIKNNPTYEQAMSYTLTALAFIHNKYARQ